MSIANVIAVGLVVFFNMLLITEFQNTKHLSILLVVGLFFSLLGAVKNYNEVEL